MRVNLWVSRRMDEQWYLDVEWYVQLERQAERKGYDVLLLAQHGLKADGLDISPTGAKTAEK